MPNFTIMGSHQQVKDVRVGAESLNATIESICQESPYARAKITDRTFLDCDCLDCDCRPSGSRAVPVRATSQHARLSSHASFNLVRLPCWRLPQFSRWRDNF